MKNNVPNIKDILSFSIPYWFNKKLDCDLYWRFKEYKKELRFSIFYIQEYKEEWGFYKWYHFKL